MKKVLLATSAMFLTVGVAHAEITFSGKGEAGIYRTGKVAAAKPLLKAGSKTQTVTLVNAAATAANTALAGSTVKLADSGTAATQTDIDNLVTALATAKASLAAATDSDAATRVKLVHDIEAIELQLAKISTGSTVAAAKASDSIAYSGYDFNVVGSATTDSGMTFGVDFDMGAGLIADQDDDRAMDAQAADVAAAKVTMSYAGVTIGFKQDGYDDLYDDSQNGDISVSGSVAGLSYTVVTDLDADVKAVAATANSYTSTNTGVIAAGNDINAANNTFNGYKAGTAATAAVYNPTSISLGYTVGDLALSYVGTEHSDNGSAANKISATYTMGDLKVTLTNDNKGSYKDVNSVALAYSAGGLGVTLTVKDDANHALNTNKAGKQSQDMKVTYAAGALGFTAATDESSNWWVNAKYDLGGGAQAFTTLDHTEFAVFGVNFAF